MTQGRIRTVFILGGMLVVGVLGWTFLTQRPRPLASSDGIPLTASPPPAAPRLAHVPAPNLPIGSEGVPIMPARADQAVPDGPVHPHPITSQHQRIFEENRLIGALNGAIDAADADGIHRFLAKYRADYPEDGQGLQDGYQAIADCLERPGPDTRAAAQRWSDLHHGSTVRRFVMRICGVD